MNKNIAQYIEQQTCASICCVDEHHQPYCFSCYYAFHREAGIMYFKSSGNSHHAVLMKNNPNIAGTILPDKLSKLLVKGIQFEGTMLDTDHSLMKDAMIYYLKQLIKYIKSLELGESRESKLDIWSLTLILQTVFS